MTSKLRTLIHLSPALLGFAGAILVGVILLPEGQYPLYFGGTICDTTRGIYACAGYPPVGIVIGGVALSMFNVLWMQALARRVKHDTAK